MFSKSRILFYTKICPTHRNSPVSSSDHSAWEGEQSSRTQRPRAAITSESSMFPNRNCVSDKCTRRQILMGTFCLHLHFLFCAQCHWCEAIRRLICFYTLQPHNEPLSEMEVIASDRLAPFSTAHLLFFDVTCEKICCTSSADVIFFLPSVHYFSIATLKANQRIDHVKIKFQANQ